MTQNQIAWFRANEEKRHNVAVEGETHRHNVNDEDIRFEGNAINREANVINQMHFERMDAESQRHNMVQETFNYANLEELSRHNRETEAQGRTSLRQTQTALKQENKKIQENRRHNRESEHISRYQSKEAKRHNQAVEAIDWANVGVGRMQAQASLGQAAAAQQNALTNQMNAQTRLDELDLARDRYSLEQWSTSQTTSATVGKVNSERDLNKAKLEYQNLQNEWYIVNNLANDLATVGGTGAAIGNAVGNAKNKPKVKQFIRP